MKYINLLCNLFQLKQNEKKTQEQVKSLQEKKLRHILRYAYEHSPYYRKTFEEAEIALGDIDTLPITAFPTIDKTVLMEHFEEIITVDDLTQEEIRSFDEENSTEEKCFKGKYHVVHSSGSTGLPRYFIYDEEAWGQMLLGIIRGALWNMSMPQILKLLWHRPRILYIAATDGRYGGAMAVGDGIDGVGASQLFLDINTPLDEWIKQIDVFRPNLIIGYPSAIKILGELVEKGQVSVDAVRVISCGEPLGHGLRNYLEKTFRCTVVNFYGASESLALGVETDEAEGMILFDDLNCIEVIDGQMYLTSLYNFVQPLIRYRISDQLVVKEDSKMRRYPFTYTEIILGRNEDIIWFETENGKREFLHPLAIEGFCVEGLVDYQFRQTSKQSFEMLAQVSEGADKTHVNEEVTKQMRTILQEKKLNFVDFSIDFVDEIMPDSHTGKKRLIAESQEET